MKIKFMSALIAAGLLLAFGAFVAHKRQVAHEIRATADAEKVSVAASDQEMGAMSRLDSYRLNDISEGIQRSGKVSDQDLDWMLNLVKHPPLRDTPQIKNYIQSDVALHMYGLTTLSARQRQALTQAAIPLLASKTSSFRLHGLFLIRVSRDPKALPFVQPLVSDQDQRVSSTATIVMKMLKQDAART